MKKILFFITLSCILISCDVDEQHRKRNEDMKTDYDIIVIDECEYISMHYASPGSNNYAFSVTHKGNCKNPKHIYNE